MTTRRWTMAISMPHPSPYPVVRRPSVGGWGQDAVHKEGVASIWHICLS